MIKFEINDIKYQVPSGWRDVTYGKYLEVMKARNGSAVELLSAMSGIPANVLENCTVSFNEELAGFMSFYHDGSIADFAVVDKDKVDGFDIKALPYKHFEYANIQIKNLWAALYPDKTELTEAEVQEVHLNAMPEIIKDYSEGVLAKWEQDKDFRKKLKKKPEILDITDMPIPVSYGIALFFCKVFRTFTTRTVS